MPAAGRRGKRPQASGEFTPACNWLPFGSPRVDLSGFRFRPTVLGTWARTMVLGPTTFWMGEGYHQHYAEKNPAAYMAYRVGCGRDRALKVVWGKS